MAIVIITFCVFYFIDFITQLFGGVTSAIGVPSASMSQAFIEPVVSKTRKRRKGMHLQESCTQNSSSISQADSTQANTSSTVDTAKSMKDMLTKSFRPGSRTHAPPESSQKPAAAMTQLKPVSAADISSSRNLAGRSPGTTEQTPETRKTSATRDVNRDYCDTPSVEFLCYDQLDERYGLPYADDFSGDEFGHYQYEQAQVYLQYIAKLDEVRTEFSIDDVSDPDKSLDEWENLDAVGMSPDMPTMTSSDDDCTESIYDQALNVFNRIIAKKENQAQKNIFNAQEGRTEKGPGDFECITKTTEMEKLLSSSEESQNKLDKGDMRPEQNDNLRRVPNFLDSEVQARCDVEDTEVPRELSLSNCEEPLHSHRSQLSVDDNASHSEDGRRTAKSLSVFSIRQSMEIRGYHHVLFTYPDPTPHKVFLTGSFFGWKMSLPMQRERNAFRLKITLPAGEHQYRFEVHRHPTSSTSDIPYIAQE
ncbi:unnamed protein product [Angiostrongylus costaricensis]|uniref:5'-AMP-activated protein kinase subunit beta-1 n=1 Tax=Angiostrongylus costaricensis TaxID=334426 RepID=A0A158PD06_ANGCS|nr:unnamed protein product [Angiostrongylus costaricensis]